jgi:c-di-GMP-binding flagellar brake protein YcgR
MSNHDYDEQRNFLRMSIKTQITYTIKNSDGHSHHGISGDLSATGLYMSTDFALIRRG